MVNRLTSFLLCVACCLSGIETQVAIQQSSQTGRNNWEIDPAFLDEAFVFVRLRTRHHGNWRTDYPDSDLNFLFRMHEMTSLQVNPDPVVLEASDRRILEYPFIYMIDPRDRGQDWYLENDEIAVLRDYLNRGGFIMVDDFWGDDTWENIRRQLKRLLPGREPEELSLSHPIFNIVFNIREKPQVPSIERALEGRDQGITWEGSPWNVPRYWGVSDDRGRLMMLICQNTDLGDGWEREGDSRWYFEEFSQKRAYPMGLNILFYVMTH